MSAGELTKRSSAATIDNLKCSSYEKIALIKNRLSTVSKSYKIGCKIGQGTFGLSSLSLAKLVGSTDTQLYVVKKLVVDDLTDKELKLIQCEVNIYAQLNHPFILPIFSTFIVNHNVIWTVLPLYNYGSCRDVICAEFDRGLPFLLVSIVLRSILLALEYLHNAGYVHRAVNASHILLNSGNRVCLSGLRHCVQLPDDGSMTHDFPSDGVQVLPWIAPEVLRQNAIGYNNRADIYSLGITAVELITGTIPYCKLRPTEILLQKLRGVVPKLPDKLDECDLGASQSSLDGIDPTNDMTFSPQTTTQSPSKKIRNLQQFVDTCLQADMDQRPSASQLCQCSFIRGVKRKMKEKDCPMFKDLLSPLTPIRELAFDKAEMMQDANIEEVGCRFQGAWIF